MNVTFGMVLQLLLPSRGKSVNQYWKEMAASLTKHSWCVLEFSLCNSFVVVQHVFWWQFGHRGPPETLIQRWYEKFCYRGCICHQGKCHAMRFGGNASIAWTSAVSHVGRTLNAFKVTMKLQTFLFQALRVPRRLRLPNFKTIGTWN
jgi:hypothetical protein